jgi:hypothetical protein
LPEQTQSIPSRVELLAQLRDQFRTLAAGEPKAALVAAKQLTNQVERETALLALVTEWKQGDLSPPRQRAWAIENYGLEAGLGMELTKNPELALQWANELTDGQGRAALLQKTAIAMLDSDPASAFALSEQFAPGERRDFVNAVFAGWAAKDTEAALRWADQMPDQAEAESALQAIRTVAPVGIGAELRVQDGYPIINSLISGSPAELSGMLHSGDRIVALAQGESAFVDTRTLPLPDIVKMIRGAPGTTLQLQVLSADAQPGALPQFVSIQRGQVKFKR